MRPKPDVFCIDARSQGINCWDKDVSRLLFSQKIADFHPFLDYVEHFARCGVRYKKIKFFE